MSSTKPEPSTTPTNIRERGGLSALFGPPPILPGESAEAWYELHAQMTAYVKPIGILEENWVREAVNYIWDDLRYGRLKQSLLAATAYQGLEEILEPLIGQPDAEVLAKRWAGREESAIEEVDEILASAGLTMDAVMGQTLSINLDVIMQIYELRASAQTGLKLTMRELERRRIAWGQHLGRAVQQPEEADLKVIAAETANTSPAE